MILSLADWTGHPFCLGIIARRKPARFHVINAGLENRIRRSERFLAGFHAEYCP